MRKFLGPEGEVEALRITDRTFDYPKPNADRIAGVWYDWRHRCARFVDGDCSQANVGDWIIRHPDDAVGLRRGQFRAILPARVASGGVKNRSAPPESWMAHTCEQ
jgi:hypothetical protein